MGYTTDFNGKFNLDRPLREDHANYLLQFAGTRRMRRDANKTALRPDPIREAVGLPVGPQGAYFVGETGYAGQDNGEDVIDHNASPSGQPGLWCQWVPSNDRKSIEWDGGEKFYDYVEWLQYIINNFLDRWGYVLKGEVTWRGEDEEDRGKIIVKNNEVTTKIGKIIYR